MRANELKAGDRGVMAQPKKVLVTDIDGTFIRSSLLIELCGALIERGIFPPIAAQDLRNTRERWEQRQGPYYDYIMSVVDVYYFFLRGCRVDDVAYAARHVAQEQRHRVYVYTRELIKKYSKRGYFLIAISGSPSPVVDEFTRLWGFDAAVSSVAQSKDGVYTGERVTLANDGKDTLLRAILEAQTDPPLTLKGSIGLGDTEGDITVLEMTERPIAFNPNANLLTHALKHNWLALIERKNVTCRIASIEMVDSNNP